MKTPWWFLHKTPMALILVPASWVYYAVSRMVYFFRAHGGIKSRRPVICVGNILAGGVGKTPIVRQIANRLNAPVVMRGYKGAANTGNPGDEVKMLAADGLQVHTGNRRANVLLLNRGTKENGPIVMDDGFQNPTVKKDISILVFDASVGVGNGFMLPAGPLREPMRALRRADAIIIVRGAGKERKMKLPDGIPVFYAHNKTINPYKAGQKLVAFAGIGYPKKFFNALKGVVACRAFADHYQYTDADIERLFALAARRGATLITTEKDWVRLPPDAQSKIKYARLETVLDESFFKWLGDKLK